MSSAYAALLTTFVPAASSLASGARTYEPRHTSAAPAVATLEHGKRAAVSRSSSPDARRRRHIQSSADSFAPVFF
ncbi:hypothetical protein PsYK624_080590 [Phanerochaete sordida]|uniref:Uncharacterized protein n=1 Tax=Phanerochaete sordida TaxID=48140 RepID=A0A9P3GC45_9APHY|nr:hypothetical protein PsYK624_080590 [Phanerochaete sordida]